MFHPNLGRWMTEDPKGFDAGDPNLYRGVENNPTNLTDPLGLDAERASVTVTPSKVGRLTASIGKFQFSAIPEGLDVHTNVDIRWRTYAGSGADRTPLSVGQYVVWLKGRDIVDTLRTKTIDLNLSPHHGGQNGVNGDDPPLAGFPNIRTPEELQDYFKKCYTARGTSGILQILVRVKGFEAVQSHAYQRPALEPTGPTEFPADMLHPSRPGQPPKPVRPNRLQRLSGNTTFFRELAPWSLDMPSFWETPSKYDEAILVTVKWNWPANQDMPSIQKEIK